MSALYHPPLDGVGEWLSAHWRLLKYKSQPKLLSSGLHNLPDLAIPLNNGKLPEYLNTYCS